MNVLKKKKKDEKNFSALNKNFMRGEIEEKVTQ